MHAVVGMGVVKWGRIAGRFGPICLTTLGLGCSVAPHEDPGSPSYAECDSAEACATDECLYDGAMAGYRCLPTCQVDADCPPAPQGRATCVSGYCEPPCSGPLHDGKSFCQDGAVRDCFLDEGGTCDQCSGVCELDQFCGPEVACVPKLAAGAPCTNAGQCLSNVCGMGGVCELPLNAPCVAGDPCLCVYGFCTQECNGTFQDHRGGCPDGFACSDGHHPLPDPDVYTQHAYCLRECQADPKLCAEGQVCQIPPDYFDVTSTRACVWD